MNTDPTDKQSEQMGRVPETTPDDALDVFHDRDDIAKPLTSRDISDELSCSRRTAHRHLTKLEERGDLTSREVGANAKVWWMPIAASDVEDAVFGDGGGDDDG